ncbi:MAG: YkgJ family cysteine cluster protein [Peptococcaceae bacterium]|nr:YkgJ family cysteine cluster protein [Peptococcaceae bacterium]
MMNLKDLFSEYESLAAKADRAFEAVKKEHGPLIKCKEQCSDCCHSVFGLFPIEAAYLRRQFSRLDRRTRRETAARADRADRELLAVEKRLSVFDRDLRLKAQAMAKERVRCPLLGGDERCVLYPHRPITCRVYGIPALINGRMHACWKAGFERGKPYPAFDLDAVYRELHRLSQRLLERAGRADTDGASLLVTVSKSIRTPFVDLAAGK